MEVGHKALEIAERLHEKENVSILVVMEVGHKDDTPAQSPLEIRGFNPCCHGSWS